MNRSSGNASKTKKLISGAGNNSKHNRKVIRSLTESSSISSNRNSSGHSEEDVRLSGVYLKAQVEKNAVKEEQDQSTRKLQAQVKHLRHKLRILEESVDTKDYSLGTLARERDRAMGEIRRLERSNRLLRQQLNEERNHYLEEKEKFCEEMTKYKKKLQDVRSESEERKGQQPLIKESLKWHFSREKGDFVKPVSSELKKSKSQLLGLREKKSIQLSTLSFNEIRKQSSFESLHLYEGNDLALQLAALRTENAKLRSIICERDDRNYELCLRFLRMKHYKNDVKDRFLDLENEYLQVIANLLDKIDEARQEFNFIIDQKFKRPLHSTNAMYLQMIQKNSRLAFENASLRLENQCLKKEIHKYRNGSSEFDRKIDVIAKDKSEGRLILNEQKAEQKLKTIKKNVNFKEIRTIYERELNFKNSDTDSNYMSKTSTAPSNISLGDAKSSETMVERKPSVHEKTENNFQANSLPEEILNKLFKRVDSSSSQTMDTERSRRCIRIVSGNDCEILPEESGDKIPEERSVGKSAPIIIEHKGPPTAVDYPSTSESKVFDTYEVNFTEVSSRGGAGETKQDGRRKGQKQANLRAPSSRWGNPMQGEWSFGSEDSNPLDLTLGRNSHTSKREKTRPKQLLDNCGLQEKLELSEAELPSTAAEAEKMRNSTRTEESDYEETDGRFRGGQARPSLTPAVGSRSRSTNKLSLYDELMEMKKRKTKTGKAPRGPSTSSLPIPRTRNSQAAVPGFNSGSEEPVTQRKPEASKRFSHRLFSTSPEQLKSILTESQMGEAFQVPPVIVGHATTEVTPAFKCEGGNEVYLHLVMPPESPSPMYANDLDFGMAETEPTEKDNSVSTYPRKSSIQTETPHLDAQLPVSSLPTSSSTVEMVEEEEPCRTRLMMRTLSAPGLLESCWLDPYSICETRDCSTNT